MKKYLTFSLTFLAFAHACNKPDAGAIVEGRYQFTPNSSYEVFNYTIVQDTLQLTKIADQFFFSEPFPYVEIKRKNKTSASFNQYVPGDTFLIDNINLTLDGGGTLLNSDVVNGKYLKGSVIAYELKYDIIDTVQKKLVRVRGVEPK
ncbi:MAG: hypothetical protein RMJ53_06855 [Chitinophagales bacterium]|nr:hypothetical protein [Chitinophagales bacterium]MDW8273929.1 hypothetical protein [Chitinophagales bacterium]